MYIQTRERRGAYKTIHRSIDNDKRETEKERREGYKAYRA